MLFKNRNINHYYSRWSGD